MNFSDAQIATTIPTKMIGPVKIVYDGKKDEVSVPIATFETPLWHSIKRGAMVSQKSAGIRVVVADDFMTRSIILEASDIETARKCQCWIAEQQEQIKDIVSRSSHFAKLLEISSENVGRLLYVRFSMSTGNASGHNMVTKAADEIAEFIVTNFLRESDNQNCSDFVEKGAISALQYVSVSGNVCTDKKVSAVNGILGRGKRVSAEIFVLKKVCETILKTTPIKICELNTKKNLLGSILAGSVRSANAHYANVLLAIFLATGQDAANIVEASQGITFADIDTDENGDERLYFSVTLPNIIVGTVGNGKGLDFAQENLRQMGCLAENPDSAKRLAAIIAATVLCAELSLMAAQTNVGELMRSHIFLERTK